LLIGACVGFAYECMERLRFGHYSSINARSVCAPDII
jgi:hypothetical protein